MLPLFIGGILLKQSTLEHRVAMIQNLREATANNEKTMSNIHSIMNNSMPLDETSHRVKSNMKYRILIALVLFGLYVFSSMNKMEYMGVGAEDIDQIMAQNMDYQEVFEQMNIPLTDLSK